MPPEKFSISKRIRSFGYAFNGIKVLFAEEHNSRIHLLAALIIVAAGFYFNLSINEWLALIFIIALVFICEIFNTAIENIADFISPEKHDAIKKIKDLSAASVLISTITSVIIGCLIFLPKIF